MPAHGFNRGLQQRLDVLRDPRRDSSSDDGAGSLVGSASNGFSSRDHSTTHVRHRPSSLGGTGTVPRPSCTSFQLSCWADDRTGCRSDPRRRCGRSLRRDAAGEPWTTVRYDIRLGRYCGPFLKRGYCGRAGRTSHRRADTPQRPSPSHVHNDVLLPVRGHPVEEHLLHPLQRGSRLLDPGEELRLLRDAGLPRPGVLHRGARRSHPRSAAERNTWDSPGTPSTRSSTGRPRCSPTTPAPRSPRG